MPTIQERADTAQAVFERRYREFQYRFVEFLVEHLTDLSREFRGDLQMPMILAVIGQFYYQSQARRGPKAEKDGSAIGITASRIADVTGISRETVRRKLAALERLGWVEKLSDSSWRLLADERGSAARRGLAQIDRRGIQRIARLFAELEQLVGGDS